MLKRILHCVAYRNVLRIPAIDRLCALKEYQDSNHLDRQTKLLSDLRTFLGEPGQQ